MEMTGMNYDMFWVIVGVLPGSLMLWYLCAVKRRGLAVRIAAPLAIMALGAGIAWLRTQGIITLPWDDADGFLGGGTWYFWGAVDYIMCMSAFAGFVVYWLIGWGRRLYRRIGNGR